MPIDEPIPADLNRAAQLMQSGRPGEAVPIYRKWVEAHPDEASHLLSLAWALYARGQAAEAMVCFERLFQKELSRSPFTGFAFDELVRIHRECRNREALISVCERAASAQPDDIGILQTLGDAYLAADRGAEALRVYESIVEREPDAPEHRCRLGDALLAAGEPVRADEEYNRAAQIDPSSASAFFSRLADGFLGIGVPEMARIAWERCLAACSEDPRYWMGFGDCLFRLGEPDAAADAYRRAAKLQPGSAGPCWSRLGNRSAREGLHALAAMAFIEASAADPGNPLYLLRLASAYEAMGKYDLAASTLRRAEALESPPARR